MAKFRKKPVVIDAESVASLLEAFGENGEALPVWVRNAYYVGTITRIVPSGFTIKTLEGDMFAAETDMLICGIKGEIYPCKADIFLATYEPVG